MAKPDYRTLLRHAGLPEVEVERIAAQAEADDVAAKSTKRQGDHTLDEDGEFDHEAAARHMEWENGIEKLIRLIGRKTGVETEGNHAIYIEDSKVTLTLGHGKTYTLAQLMDFANKIASQGVGSNLVIGCNSDQQVELSFDLIVRD